MLRGKRHAETAAEATQKARSFQNEKKKESVKKINDKKQEKLKKRLMESAPKEQGAAPPANTEAKPAKRQKVDKQAVKNIVKV
jgi:hypothetical protein